MIDMPKTTPEIRGKIIAMHECGILRTTIAEKLNLDLRTVSKWINRNEKEGKSDGKKGLISNHLLNASHKFFINLPGLLNAIRVHGHQPSEVLNSVIYSIPKDNRGDLCTDTNYRGISLTSSISKVLDIIILTKNKDRLQTSDLQFAFKKDLGTNTCTLLVKEVAKYYMNNGSNVYASYLDASKAFDRIRYDKLFQLLLDRNIDMVDLRALLDLYLRQSASVTWDGQYSDPFSSINGIRQGGIISPILYCIYTDELLCRLKHEGYGCWLGHQFLGAVCYADDMTLLSPSVGGLQKMIHECEKFALEYSVEYNPSKSVSMIFTKQKLLIKPVVALFGKPLSWVTHVKHLGNFISGDLSESKEVQFKRGDLVGRVNTLLANCGDAPDRVLIKLFSTQCSHFYGSTTWNLADKNVKFFHTMWNRCMRRLLVLPNQTHRRFLPHASGIRTSEEKIFTTFVKCMQKMLTSDNAACKFVATYGVGHADSIIGSNLRTIARKTGQNTNQVLENKQPIRMLDKQLTDDRC